MTVDELLDLKKQIDESRSKLSELKGKKQALMESLERYGCKTLKEAKKKLAQLKTEIENLEEKRKDRVTKLEDDYEF